MEGYGWRALSKVGIVVGLLLILSGRIIKLFNFGRGGVTAFIISTVTIPVTLLFLLLVYFEWYSTVRSIAAFHILATLYYALSVWQNIGGNIVFETVFYNGVGDWMAFLGAIVVTLGMLPFAYLGTKSSLFQYED
jgi:hypothetical protein